MRPHLARMLGLAAELEAAAGGDVAMRRAVADLYAAIARAAVVAGCHDRLVIQCDHGAPVACDAAGTPLGGGR